jgi:hypothetical protein
VAHDRRSVQRPFARRRAENRVTVPSSEQERPPRLRLKAHGGKLAQYEDVFLLCYLRGPAGIIVAPAEEIG